MKKDCIFCKIADKEISSDIVYEDGMLLAFRDLAPQAPVHVLIISKTHIASLDDIGESLENREMFGHLILKVREIAASLGLEKGYRLVCNCGEDGLQTVGHLHFHLIGGRKMGWPPG
jgi:histidine triad (HIT) family protein